MSQRGHHDEPSITAATAPPVATLSDFALSGQLAVGRRMGTFEIVSFLGAGGMGDVYRARDSALGRDVALKFLRAGRFAGAGASAARARLLREAQAMARLSHPNVVTVFEVGELDDNAYVAMELIDGQTLSAWLRERPRGRREILDVFVRAGRGLAAVHETGLVHRDFKPANTLVGRDGRVRVTDFGLAGRSAAPEGDEVSEPIELAETALGSTSGTPAFMAPEQHLRGPIDARADQFAFCVALWQALYGTRPFAGGTYDELRVSVLAGKIVEPPAAAHVPTRIRTILTRGMARDPAARYPSMNDLLAALEHDPSVLWRRVILGVALVAAAGGLFLAARRTASPVATPCVGLESHLAGVWDPAVRKAVETSFGASGRPYAAVIFGHASTGLDKYASAWTAARTEACEATSVRGEQSADLLDRRMECLDRRLEELRALTRHLAIADGEIVDRSVAAVGKLESLDECEDNESLKGAMALPADPAAREQIMAVRSQVQDFHTLRLLGKVKAASDKIGPLVAQAEALDYPPVEMAVLDELVWTQGIKRDFKSERATRERILQLAARLKNDRKVAIVWCAMINSLAGLQDKADEALALQPAAEAAVVRAGDLPRLRGALLAALAEVYMVKDDFHTAETTLRQAIALMATDPLQDPLDFARVVNTLGIVLARAGRYDESVATFRQVEAIYEQHLAPDHPWVAGLRMNVGDILMSEGHIAEARAEFEHTLAIFESNLGPDAADTAMALNNLAQVDSAEGHYDVALPLYERAVAIKEKTLGPDHHSLAETLYGMGETLTALGRYDEAGAVYMRVAAIYQKSAGGSETTDFAGLLAGEANLARRRGRYTEALDLSRKSIALFEKIAGPDYPELPGALIVDGQCEVALGRPRDAVIPLERALLIRALKLGPSTDVPEAQLALADARWHIAVGDPTAIALAEQARAEFVAFGSGQQPRVDEIDRWLATRKK